MDGESGIGRDARFLTVRCPSHSSRKLGLHGRAIMEHGRARIADGLEFQAGPAPCPTAFRARYR